MKKLILCLQFAIVLSMGMVLVPTVSALGDYTVLSPLPGTTKDNCTSGATCQSNFETYLPGLFKFSIGLAGVLAFVMITFGGILYATTDAIQSKSEGRKYIENAVVGLLMVIGAYAILYTINPQFLEFKLSIPRPAITFGSPSVVPGLMSDADLSSDASARAALASHNITAYRGTCSNGATTNCVNLNGLQQTTVTGLETLQEACTQSAGQSCNISIQGGTEPGHSTNSAHNTGNAVDFAASADLNKVITNNGANTGTGKFENNQLSACAVVSYSGGSYLWEPKGSTCGGDVASSGDHWHATYK